MITCVRLPHFAAHLEARAHPELKGKAVVLVEWPSSRSRFMGFHRPPRRRGSPRYAAPPGAGPLRSSGIQPATPGRYQETFEIAAGSADRLHAAGGAGRRGRTARRCPPGTPATFLHLAQIDDFPTPTCYLDLGKLKPDAAQVWPSRLTSRSRTGGLPPSSAWRAANSRRVSRRRRSTRANCILVPSGQEAPFLAGFTAALLPVDGETLRQLDLLGLYTLGQVAALPVSALLDRFGKQGRTMHRLANGRDTRPVGTYQPPMVERAQRRWDDPLADWARLDALLSDMVSEAAARLLDKNQTIQHLTLLLTQEDGTSLSGRWSCASRARTSGISARLPARWAARCPYPAVSWKPNWS